MYEKERSALAVGERRSHHEPVRRRSADAVLDLQRAAGNAAVARMLQRQRAVLAREDIETEGGDPHVKDWQRQLNRDETLPEQLIIDGLHGPKSATGTRIWEWRTGKPITGTVPREVVVDTHGGGS